MNSSQDHTLNFGNKMGHQLCSGLMWFQGDMEIFTWVEGSLHFPFRYSKPFGFISELSYFF